MIQVGLRRRVRVAVESYRELVDRGDLEGSGAKRADAAVRAGGDLRGGHAGEDVLGDDANPQRQRKCGLGRAEGEHHLARTSRRHTDLAPNIGTRLLVLDVLKDVEGEQHVVGAERLTVPPLHAVSDVEGVREVIS